MSAFFSIVAAHEYVCSCLRLVSPLFSISSNSEYEHIGAQGCFAAHIVENIRIMIKSVNSSPNYINSLTSMRGIAAIWVMLFHIDVSLFYRGFGALLPHDQTGFFSKGYLWVDFFFLLSGFVIAYVYSQPLANKPRTTAIKHYLWARFTRIYPLHLFTLLVLVFVTSIVEVRFPAVIDGSWKTYFAWSALPSNLMLTQAMNQHVYLSWNMVSWSIAAEWWTYVISIPVLIFLRERSLVLIVVWAMLASIGLVVLVNVFPQKNLDITFNYGFLRCLFEFNIGIALYQIFFREKMKIWLSRDWIVVALLFAITLIFHECWNDLWVIPCFSILILALAYNTTIATRVLNIPVFQYLGKISYSIYMVHCLWFMVFWFSLPQLKTWGFTEFSSFEKLAYTFAFVVLTLASSHFTYHFIEISAQKKLRAFFGERLQFKK
jgi:peptidoglycan/LPS O-acetylase OafA/YrhL